MPNTVKKQSPLAKLMVTLKPQSKFIIFGILLGLVGTLSRLFAPLAIKQLSNFILDGITPGHSMDFSKIYLFGFLAIGLYVVGSVLDYINIHLMVGVSTETARSLRMRMEKKINTLPLNYFDTRNIGDVLSYFTNDVDIINQTLTNSLSSLVSSLVTVLGVLVILFVLQWKIALVALVALPICLFVLIIIGGRSEKQFINRQKVLSEVSARAEETYAAYNIVRAFRANDRFIRQFEDANNKLKKISQKADFLADLMNPAMSLLGNVMVAGICLVGGAVAYYAAQASGAAVDPAIITTVVAAVTYGEQLITPLTQLATIIASLSQTSAACDRVFSFLEEVDQIDETEKTGKIEKIEGNISFEHVKFGYNSSRVIIHDFSEKAVKGQKVAIVGPTGAGKTTMVNLLMRFYDINSGKISIEGVDTQTLNRSYVRSLFGMVLQDTWLFNGTFMENLKFSRRDATDEEVYAACKATHCDLFIRQQPGGYNGVIGEECGLSSGQKQLLTIARAMVQNAPMLILDEATSSVDTRTELLIQDAMDKLMKGRTSFVIAHRLSTIKNSNLILVMKDGDVIESGNHDELMAKDGFYASLYNAQFTGKGPQID